jgi:DNA-binding NarL/FixJ family response regulator
MAAGTPEATIRVLLIEDHDVVRAGLRLLLEEDGGFAVCGEAGSIERGLELALATRPDIALIDVQLGGDSGVELCRRLRDEVPTTRSVILTSATEDAVVLDAIDAGAAAYLLKRVDRDALTSALRTVAKGGSLLDPTVTGQLLARIREGGLTGGDPRLRGLSSRQRELLALLGRGLTNKEIAAELFLSEKTVRNYVSELLAKLGMSNRTEAAVFSAKLGR